MKNEPLEFDVWCDVFGDEISIEAAESGSDREINYDPSWYLEKKYNEYLSEVQ